MTPAREGVLMSDQPSKPFHLADEPTESSVSLLRSRFRDDTGSGTVSPKAHAHRSRVIRQQSRLLELAQSSDTPTDESPELSVEPSSGKEDDRVTSSAPAGAAEARKLESFTA